MRPRGLRWVRTGYACQPAALGTYRRRGAACPQGPTYCTYRVRVPASAVPLPYQRVRTAYRGTPGGECLRVVPGPGDTLQMAPGPGGGVDVYLNQLQLGGGHAEWARLREAVLDPESTPQSIATT